MTPKREELLIDSMIQNDIDFSRECRGELLNPQLPEQIEMFEEEI